MHPRDPNREMLEAVVERLGPLADEMVFVGGCATGLLITDPGAPEVRPTRDVDAIVEIASRVEFHRLQGSLRDRGFVEDDSPDAPISRWRHEKYVLDVMPTDERVLGFGNAWYRAAWQCAATLELPGGRVIRHIPAPLFLATKLAAFDGRGAGDYLSSHDLEDFVAVVDGRPTLLDEFLATKLAAFDGRGAGDYLSSHDLEDFVAVVDGRPTLLHEFEAAEDNLKRHLAERIGRLLDDPDFEYALPGLLPADAASQARVGTVRERLASMAERGR